MSLIYSSNLLAQNYSQIQVSLIHSGSPVSFEHPRIHKLYCNPDHISLSCPLCYHKRLWKILSWNPSRLFTQICLIKQCICAKKRKDVPRDFVRYTFHYFALVNYISLPYSEVVSWCRISLNDYWSWSPSLLMVPIGFRSKTIYC